jgi:nickel-dependent lactate racemase
VLPALCGAESILSNHGFAMLNDPHATWCEAESNPIFQDIRSIALATRPSFIVNVTLNEKKETTGVFAGEPAAAHDAGIAQAARQALTPIPHLYDIVVATNMGWPADLNLYQSMKAMSVAAQAVKKGGKIIVASECGEGIGNDDFLAVLRSGPSYPALMEKIGAPGFAADEQWGVQCIGMVWEKAEIYFHSAISREVVEDEAHLHYCADVSATVAALAEEFRRANDGREPAICVLPYGQLTVPRLKR